MWLYLLEAATWALTRRKYLRERFAKYFNRPGPPPKFDGAAIEKLIDEYEPIVWRVFIGELSLAGAVWKIVTARFGPHPMNKAEEKIWHDNASGGSTPGNF